MIRPEGATDCQTGPILAGHEVSQLAVFADNIYFSR